MLKRILVVTVFVLNALVLSHCGSDTKYSYELSSNGCSTEKHEFSSKDEMCSGLQSSSLNKGCALSMREQYFKSNSCTGTFSPRD